MSVMVYEIWPAEIGNSSSVAPAILAPLSYGVGTAGGGGVIQMTTLQAIGTDQG